MTAVPPLPYFVPDDGRAPANRNPHTLLHSHAGAALRLLANRLFSQPYRRDGHPLVATRLDHFVTETKASTNTPIPGTDLRLVVYKDDTALLGCVRPGAGIALCPEIFAADPTPDAARYQPWQDTCGAALHDATNRSTPTRHLWQTRPTRQHLPSALVRATHAVQAALGQNPHTDMAVVPSLFPDSNGAWRAYCQGRGGSPHLSLQCRRLGPQLECPTHQAHRFRP